MSSLQDRLKEIRERLSDGFYCDNPNSDPLAHESKPEAKERTMTVVIKFDQNNKPDWIWNAHGANKMVNGVYVIGIANGNAIEELEQRDIEEIEAMERGDV